LGALRVRHDQVELIEEDPVALPCVAEQLVIVDHLVIDLIGLVEAVVTLVVGVRMASTVLSTFFKVGVMSEMMNAGNLSLATEICAPFHF
jgi:hypothetical protein